MISSSRNPKKMFYHSLFKKSYETIYFLNLRKLEMLLNSLCQKRERGNSYPKITFTKHENDNKKYVAENMNKSY